MCHRIGRPPISTMGLGREAVSSDRRVPSPPARMTTFTTLSPSLDDEPDRWRQCIRQAGGSPAVPARTRLRLLRRGGGSRELWAPVSHRVIQVERLLGPKEEV